MTGEIQTFARVEKKFLLNRRQAEDVAAGLRMRGYERMAFGSSAIQSVYWDTPDYLLIRRSLERPEYKEKFRTRMYGQPGEGDMEFAEIKKKYRGVVYKRRTGLILPEMERALAERAFPEKCGQIGAELKSMMDRYDLRPACLIMYNREAYAREGDEEIRVTMDTGIRFRTDMMDMTRAQTGEEILDRDQVLMEVKIPGVWPLWLLRLLQSAGAQPTHISKYGTAYLILAGRNRIPGNGRKVYSIA